MPSLGKKKKRVFYILVILLLSSCGHSRIFNGKPYHEVWYASLNVAHRYNVGDKTHIRELEDEGVIQLIRYEDSLENDIVSWSTCGGIGKKADTMTIRVEELSKDEIEVTVLADNEVIFAYNDMINNPLKGKELEESILNEIRQRLESGKNYYDVPPFFIYSNRDRVFTLEEEEAYREETKKCSDSLKSSDDDLNELYEQNKSEALPTASVPVNKVNYQDAPDTHSKTNIVEVQHAGTHPTVLEEMMVVIPAGEFIMGAGKDEDNKVPYKVYLDTYQIDRYEVTNQQYALFLNEVKRFGDERVRHPSQPAGKGHTPYLWREKRYIHPMQPVVGVDWYDAYAYARWAGKELPTEAQWERATRGASGLERTQYPWGDSIIKAAVLSSNLKEPAIVGSFPLDKTPMGVLDMAGNVKEWCQDFYSKYTYQDGEYRNPNGPTQGHFRVLRGASWKDELSAWSVNARVWANPMTWSSDIGFRCVRSVQKQNNK